MEIVKYKTESYLFETLYGQIRAIPFYELSIDEWVIFENSQPKYLLDFNRRNKPLIQDIRAKIDLGEKFDDLIWKLGQFLGRNWTIKHNVEGIEIEGSQQLEEIDLILLDDLSEYFIDLTFIATNNIDLEIFLNEDKLFDKGIQLESAYIDNFDNIYRMLAFIFKTDINFVELISTEDKQVFDLTQYKSNCIGITQFESNYQGWINISKRENSMNEFGNLLGIISFINSNLDKQNLILITEKRKNWK